MKDGKDAPETILDRIAYGRTHDAIEIHFGHLQTKRMSLSVNYLKFLQWEQAAMECNGRVVEMIG